MGRQSRHTVWCDSWSMAPHQQQSTCLAHESRTAPVHMTQLRRKKVFAKGQNTKKNPGSLPSTDLTIKKNKEYHTTCSAFHGRSLPCNPNHDRKFSETCGDYSVGGKTSLLALCRTQSNGTPGLSKQHSPWFFLTTVMDTYLEAKAKQA
jgi:hypothetical protein